LPRTAPEQPKQAVGGQALGQLIGGMPSGDVRHFVREHAGQLRLVGGRLNAPLWIHTGPPGSAKALISR
jgi:hypothetical protein